MNKIFEKITWEQFANLISMIESRTLCYKNSEDPKGNEIGALVPYLDFVNHKFLPEIKMQDFVYYDSNSKSYILKAYKDFEVNE